MSLGTNPPETRELISSFISLAPPLSKLIATTLADSAVGLSYRQYVILTRVYEGQDSLTVLSRNSSVSMPTLSKSTAMLEERQLLQRTVDPSDRRRAKLIVTKMGQERLNEANERLENMVAALASNVIASLPAKARQEDIDTLVTVVAVVLDRVRHGRREHELQSDYSPDGQQDTSGRSPR